MGEVEPTEAKRALRERMRRVRSRIPVAERQAMAERVAENLFAIREVTSARTVLLFYSFGSEVPTAAMVERFRAKGRRVLLPYLGDEGMHAAEAGDELVATSYGPREPRGTVAVDPGEIDLVVTPGLAFDREGRRLGYGGGHYDRYLRRLAAHAVRIGIGFGPQVVEEVPAEAGDERVDLVVTDEGVIDCAERRGQAPPHDGNRR